MSRSLRLLAYLVALLATLHPDSFGQLPSNLDGVAEFSFEEANAENNPNEPAAGREGNSSEEIRDPEEARETEEEGEDEDNEDEEEEEGDEIETDRDSFTPATGVVGGGR